jgi:hypothetical protein
MKLLPILGGLLILISIFLPWWFVSGGLFKFTFAYQSFSLFNSWSNAENMALKITTFAFHMGPQMGVNDINNMRTGALNILFPDIINFITIIIIVGGFLGVVGGFRKHRDIYTVLLYTFGGFFSLSGSIVFCFYISNMSGGNWILGQNITAFFSMNWGVGFGVVFCILGGVLLILAPIIYRKKPHLI